MYNSFHSKIYFSVYIPEKSSYLHIKNHATKDPLTNTLYCVIFHAGVHLSCIKIGRHKKHEIVMSLWVSRAGVIYPLLCICVSRVLHCKNISDMFQFSKKKKRKASLVFTKAGEICKLCLWVPPSQG